MPSSATKKQDRSSAANGVTTTAMRESRLFHAGIGRTLVAGYLFPVLRWHGVQYYLGPPHSPSASGNRRTPAESRRVSVGAGAVSRPAEPSASSPSRDPARCRERPAAASVSAGVDVQTMRQTAVARATLVSVPCRVRGVGSPLEIIVDGGPRAPVFSVKGAVLPDKAAGFVDAAFLEKEGAKALGVSKRDRHTRACSHKRPCIDQSSVNRV